MEKRADSHLLAPLGVPAFRALWIATIFSNLGTLMQNVGAVWLMTTLTPSTVMVGLLQTSASLPFLIVGLLAGALADVFDRRKMMIVTQTTMAGIAGTLTVLTWSGQMKPELLLGLTFALGLTSAFNIPTWQAMLGDIVGHKLLPSAVSLNSVSFNTARSVGPALGGLIVAASGPGMVFLLNTLSFAGMLWSLFRWKPAPLPRPRLEEDVFGAIQAGLRYVIHAERLKAPFIWVCAFTLCAGAIWTLLPLYARLVLDTSAAGYGILLGAFGLGSICAALLAPKARATFSLDAIATTATASYSLAMFAIAFVPGFPAAIIGTFVCGASWIILMINLNVAVQTSVPAWVRGRAVACYILVFQGGLALSGVLWGWLAGEIGTQWTFVAVGGAIALGLPISLRYRLEKAEDIDLSPSLHWPEPVLSFDADTGRSPVLVTIEYRINPEDVAAFSAIMDKLREGRLRDGARVWRLYRDADDPNRLIELYRVDSWQEHLRQRDRATMEDKTLEAQAHAYHKGDHPPKMDHWVAVER